MIKFITFVVFLNIRLHDPAGLVAIQFLFACFSISFVCIERKIIHNQSSNKFSPKILGIIIISHLSFNIYACQPVSWNRDVSGTGWIFISL